MINEIGQSQKKINSLWFHLHEVYKVVKFIKTEDRMVVARGWRKGEMESRLTVTEFQFCKTWKLLELCCKAVWIHWSESAPTAITKHVRLGGLKNVPLFSQSGPGSLRLRGLVRTPSCSSHLLTVVSVDSLQHVCTWRGSELSGISYEDTSPIRSGATIMSSLNCNYFLRGPISKYSHTEG